jgi:hypothetical protein
VVVTPVAAWIWLCEGWRRPAAALVAFAAGVLAEVIWLADAGAHGWEALIAPTAGLEGATGWGIGVTGLAALAWSVAGPRRSDRSGLGPDRVLLGVFGLSGLGVLFQQVARMLV